MQVISLLVSFNIKLLTTIIDHKGSAWMIQSCLAIHYSWTCLSLEVSIDLPWVLIMPLKIDLPSQSHPKTCFLYIYLICVGRLSFTFITLIPSISTYFNNDPTWPHPIIGLFIIFTLILRIDINDLLHQLVRA